MKQSSIFGLTGNLEDPCLHFIKNKDGQYSLVDSVDKKIHQDKFTVEEGKILFETVLDDLKKEVEDKYYFILATIDNDQWKN